MPEDNTTADDYPDGYPTFTKMQLAKGKAIPVNAVIKVGPDRADQRKFKFSYVDRSAADLDEPGELQPDRYNVAFLSNPSAELKAAAEGIEKFTEFTVRLSDD